MRLAVESEVVRSKSAIGDMAGRFFLSDSCWRIKKEMLSFMRQRWQTLLQAPFFSPLFPPPLLPPEGKEKEEPAQSVLDRLFFPFPPPFPPLIALLFSIAEMGGRFFFPPSFFFLSLPPFSNCLPPTFAANAVRLPPFPLSSPRDKCADSRLQVRSTQQCLSR